MSPRKATPPGDILAVDDLSANLEILTRVLEARGHRVRSFSSGRPALEAARKAPPDLILLDINMPDMDGYQVCATLKADPRLAPIPVIFISANSEGFDKVTAFSLGGVDYVTKPFQFEELEARVETHLELSRQKKALEKSFGDLTRLETLRDSLVHMMVHDLRSPLSALGGFLECLQMSSSSMTQEQREDLKEAVKASQRMALMVNGILEANKLESGKMKLNLSPCDAKGLAVEVLASLFALTEGRDLTLSPPLESLPAVLDKGLVFRVLQNLVANALRYTPREGGKVEVKVEKVPEGVRFQVKDNGSGIPSEHHAALFDKFFQVEEGSSGPHVSTGLGLPFCKMAVEAQGGKIGVESAAGHGSTFWFTLPQ